MNLLTKDVLFNIATFLPLNDLLSFCSSSDRINRLVCKDKNIWNFKLMKEFPNYKDHINQKGREAYELLIALNKLKKEFKYQGTIYDLYKETKLDLSYKGLTIVPPEIGNLSNLQSLNLSTNQITILPPEIGNLSQLQMLYLDNNQIAISHPEIGNLIQLRTLRLDNNQIAILPPEIGNLSRLQKLYLDNNQITTLPPEIGKLTNLKYFGLENNKIEILPPEIGNLKNLEDLYLRLKFFLLTK